MVRGLRSKVVPGRRSVSATSFGDHQERRTVRHDNSPIVEASQHMSNLLASHASEFGQTED